MSSFAWGEKETHYFFELTPDRILNAVEALGLECTGRCLTLNSMENRVYEVEIIIEDEEIRNPSDKFRIVKFYRPGRWSEAQIQEEHQFLLDLQAEEIPVIAPVVFEDGKTLHRMTEIDIWYTIFPKMGGRNPDELTDPQVEQIGRLLARMHNVGAVREAPHRIQLTPETYGLQNLEYLLASGLLPMDIESRYRSTVEEICEISAPWFSNAEVHRIHGDCHMGNLLWGRQGPFWVDFDDMVRGPCVQDIWLICPGRDDWAIRQRNLLIDAYDTMRPFPYQTLRLIEPLRALRFVHFNAWIGKRWSDPAFPRSFGHYGTPVYWLSELNNLQDQLQLIRETASAPSPFH